MSLAREMLDSLPTQAVLDTAELASAIEACFSAAQACTACADACLAEDEVAALRTCIALDAECADICATTARVLSRSPRSDHLVVHRLLQACVRSCGDCAEECARHGEHHRHCAICATACRACAHACATLLDAEAFDELQKLAGA